MLGRVRLTTGRVREVRSESFRGETTKTMNGKSKRKFGGVKDFARGLEGRWRGRGCLFVKALLNEVVPVRKRDRNLSLGDQASILPIRSRTRRR